MSALPKRYFTPEEYLELELKAEYKSQYVAGEIYAMAGAQPWHDRVVENLSGMLYTLETTVNLHSLLNPQVIFEVLSPSTEAFDRGDKFLRYQQLESLTDYVLVSSEQMRVERFMRQSGGHWQYREHHLPGAQLPLASLGCELPLAEIYERVTFPESISR